MQNIRHLCERLVAVSLGVKPSVERGFLCTQVKPPSAKTKGWPNELPNASSNIVKEGAAKHFHMMITKCLTNQHLQF